MDTLIGGLIIALGVGFIGVGVAMSGSLDGLALTLVVTGGAVVALFGVTVASSAPTRHGGRQHDD